MRKPTDGSRRCAAAAASDGQRAAERAGVQKLYGACARLFEQVFAIDSKLANDVPLWHRYQAACAAALAGCGQGTDDDQQNDKERARLRMQAVAWLRADLGFWSKQADSKNPADRMKAQQALQHWQSDTDLAGIRDRDAVAKLPADEREACRQLWADVADLLKRVDNK